MKPFRLPAALLGVLCVACGHPQRQNPPPSAALPPPASATVQGAGPGEPTRTLAQMLEGKIAGVTVTQLAGGGIAVRMMGPTSFNDANEGPLFIVDGTQVEARPGGALPWINPRDIESITALKNPADIAIYGVRGANGVIIIKTKQGNPR